MGYGDFIILGAFAIGYIIIFSYQKNKISSLKIQLESLESILSAMQQFMSIFKLEDIERYVEMSRKTSLMEKEDDIKILKEKFETMTKMKYDFLLNEYLDIFDVLINLSFAFGSFPYFETTIQEMKSTLVKERITKSINKGKSMLNIYHKKRNEIAKKAWEELKKIGRGDGWHIGGE